MVAMAKMVGLICSLRPLNISQGKVFKLAEPTKRTTTTSSNDVMNANNPPDITPGSIRGICILKNVLIGPAPKLAEARVRLLSNPVSVAVTVMMTKGIPRAAWARTTPI